MHTSNMINIQCDITNNANTHTHTVTCAIVYSVEIRVRSGFRSFCCCRLQMFNASFVSPKLRHTQGRKASAEIRRENSKSVCIILSEFIKRAVAAKRVVSLYIMCVYMIFVWSLILFALANVFR